MLFFKATKMKIKRLKIENFRGIVDDTIDFDPSFTDLPEPDSPTIASDSFS